MVEVYNGLMKTTEWFDLGGRRDKRRHRPNRISYLDHCVTVCLCKTCWYHANWLHLRPQKCKQTKRYVKNNITLFSGTTVVIQPICHIMYLRTSIISKLPHDNDNVTYPWLSKPEIEAVGLGHSWEIKQTREHYVQSRYTSLSENANANNQTTTIWLLVHEGE